MTGGFPPQSSVMRNALLFHGVILFFLALDCVMCCFGAIGLVYLTITNISVPLSPMSAIYGKHPDQVAVNWSLIMCKWMPPYTLGVENSHSSYFAVKWIITKIVE